MSGGDGGSGRRPGRGGFTKKGKPRPGTGGYGKRRLEGKGPTPPAHLRPGHPAQRRTAARQAGRPADDGGSRAAGQPGDTGRDTGTRRADGHEIVVGRNAVLEALQAAVPGATLYVAYRTETDDRVHASVKLAADAGVPVLEIGRAELDRLTQGAVHQGLALRVRPYQYAHPGDLTARAAAAGDPPLIVALDGVTDPRNLGAVVRCAAAFGAHGVVIPARRSAGVSAGAWKASAGTLARLPVAQASNLARTLAAYQENGLFVVGLAADGSTDVADLELATSPLVLVVGSEGKGLSRVVAERCDLLVRIPIADAESLNASVAAGVALYEAARRRSAPNG
ncbi:MAG TPA: 23S rRNA (guanosine(2251)-2'-O)-methyltransferase RlmB [Streptosporangiaceae bacterium]|nr:23S rRNA (guanosine(2251)-2'-O)-methyltransferase RlmB [Streptosporangiaceae bacterium]